MATETAEKMVAADLIIKNGTSEARLNDAWHHFLVGALTSTSFIFEAKVRHVWTDNRLIKVFDSWISLKWLYSKVMAIKPFFAELAQSAIDDHGSSLMFWKG